MPPYQPATAARNTPLVTLNREIEQSEAAGPLARIRDDGNQTVLDFDMGQIHPDKIAVLRKSSDSAMADSTVVCKGKIYLDGNLTEVTADRPN